MRAATAAVAAALLANPAAGAAQGLAARCDGAVSGYCMRAAQAAEIMLTRTAIAAALGNPVPGTASTLGMRIGSMPRFAITGRFGLARASLPRIGQTGATGDHGASITSLGGDLSVGLFSGVALGPTVGGFGSIDLLASLVRVGLPDDDGWRGGSLHSWGLGARFGILRESFTAPGLSVSLVRRGMGEFEYGRSDFADESAFIHADELSSWSVRAAVGKRVAGIGLTGGLGWDRASGNMIIAVQDGATFEFERSGFDASRLTVWADASFTLLILSAVVDVGWQSGGDAPPAGPGHVTDGAFYGAFALRIAI